MYKLKMFAGKDGKETNSIKTALSWIKNGERICAYLTDNKGCTVMTWTIIDIDIDNKKIVDTSRSYFYTGFQVEPVKIFLITFFDDHGSHTCSVDEANKWIQEGNEVSAIFIRDDDQLCWNDLDSAWSSIGHAATYHSSPIKAIDEESRIFRTRSGSLYDFS